MTEIPDFQIVHSIKNLKQQIKRKPINISFKIETPSYNSPDVEEQTIRSDSDNSIWALTQIRKINHRR